MHTSLPRAVLLAYLVLAVCCWAAPAPVALPDTSGPEDMVRRTDDDPKVQQPQQEEQQEEDRKDDRVCCTKPVPVNRNTTQLPPPPPPPPPAEGEPSEQPPKDGGGIVRQYSRGWGQLPASCPADRPVFDELMCYAKCSKGYNGHGPFCTQGCPKDYVDMKTFCYLSPISWFVKKVEMRGLGTLPLSCRDNMDSHTEQGVLLCYPKCKDGYVGIGPLCLVSEVQ